MSQKESDQIKKAKAIFNGITLDKDGYCGCPKCGSRELLHDGHTLDNGYISCINCYYSINGNDPYEMVSRWNRIDRESFQLKIFF
jgi:hypothetical protein